MNELQIVNYLNSDRYTSKHFVGVFARDEIIKQILKPGLYVVNTDISSGPGIHWVCIYVNSNQVDYFDSLGLPPDNFLNFLRRQKKKYLYSTKQLQSTQSDVCGDYCILYAYFKCRGYSLLDFVNLFTNYVDYNDLMVEL